MEDLWFLLPPFIMCILLVGIHCYLGIHVLARGVIFVDLALAQTAAFGAALALVFGFDHHDLMTYFISLGSTLFVAAFLAYTNRFRFQISQEAIIGIIYALMSATVILLIDRLSHGSEHLKQTLVGHLLWVTWPDVIKVAVIYTIVGGVHYWFRKHFITASFQGGASAIWDFLFYALFGLVITSSVQYAGILLVFSFLIVPSLVSSLFTSNLKNRLFIGWGFGILFSFLGMIISYFADLPSGAVIVTTFTLVPLIGLLFWKKRGALKDDLKVTKR